MQFYLFSRLRLSVSSVIFPVLAADNVVFLTDVYEQGLKIAEHYRRFNTSKRKYCDYSFDRNAIFMPGKSPDVVV